MIVVCFGRRCPDFSFFFWAEMRLIQIPEAIYWALTMLLGAADKARSFSCFFLVFSFRFFRGKPTGRRGRGQFRRENGADDALKRRFLKKKISYVKTAQGATTNAGRLLCSTRMTKEACVFFSYFLCEKKRRVRQRMRGGCCS